MLLVSSHEIRRSGEQEGCFPDFSSSSPCVKTNTGDSPRRRKWKRRCLLPQEPRSSGGQKVAGTDPPLEMAVRVSRYIAGACLSRKPGPGADELCRHAAARIIREP